MLGSLPYDCRFNTGSGFSFRKANPDGTTSYSHVYCNMMTCRSCAKWRCLTAIRAIKEAIITQKMLTHVTYTLPQGIQDHEQGRKLARALRRLLLNIGDKVKHPFAYVWAYGCGKNGRLHLHLVTNVIRNGSQRSEWGVTKKWVKERWHKLTGAIQTHITDFPVTDARKQARYLMKNVMETVLDGYRLPRRFGSCRDIKLLRTRGTGDKASDDGDGKWERVKGPTARHGLRLGVLEPNYGLNPTFNAPKQPEPETCEGTDADWPEEEYCDEQSKKNDTETTSVVTGVP